MAPELARMARDFQPIPGTTVPVERRFCNGADLIGPNRSQLAIETIQTCLELKEYLVFGGEQLFLHIIETMNDSA